MYAYIFKRERKKTNNTNKKNPKTMMRWTTRNLPLSDTQSMLSAQFQS